MVKARRVAAMRAFWDAVRGVTRPGAPGLWQRLRALPRMLVHGLNGRYPYLSKPRLAMAVLALVYLVSPVDLIPELFVPVLGLGDDAVVAAWLAGVLLSETETFLTWERDRSRTVVGEVIAR
jgi:uncharacterized membrane protein YkvA (DUF1232 family)